MSEQTPASIKDRVERQLARDLSGDTFLAALLPTTQNSDGRPAHPYIVVVARPAGEYAAQGGIFKVPADIELHYDSSRGGQSGADMDTIAGRVYTRLRAMQAAGNYGLTIDGEQQRLDGQNNRVRAISVTVIGA